MDAGITWAQLFEAERQLRELPEMELWGFVGKGLYWVEKSEADIWRTDYLSAVAP